MKFNSISMARFAALSVAGAAFLGVSTTASASGFTGYYDHSNWAITLQQGNSHISTATTTTLTLVGNNDGSGAYADLWYEIAIGGDGMMSFDWSYFSTDEPEFDASWYYHNGTWTFLSDTTGESGHVDLAVSTGDVFRFSVDSVDGLFGPGELTITNFSAPVPEPATMAALGLGVAALLRRRRK